MRIVHSLWTAHAKAVGRLLEFRGGWPTAELYWYSWALSCIQAERTHGRIDLVTDADGAKILVDRLGLPYHDVSIELEELDVHPGLWSYGKIVAYGVQREPFLHIDSDVYLWKTLPQEYFEAPLVVQCLEHHGILSFGRYYDPCRREIEKHLKMLPKSWLRFASDRSAFCMGVFGGQDLAAIAEYVRQVAQIVESVDNREGWEEISKLGFDFVRWCNCSIEQLTAYCVFNELGKWPRPLFYGDELGNGFGRIDELRVTHVMAGKYSDTDLHSRLAKRMETDHPEIVDAVSRLLYG